MQFDTHSVSVLVLFTYIFYCTIAFTITKEKDLLKIIGGSIVILAALFANVHYIYVIAMLIAGLIVASERFMSLLASLVRGDNAFLVSENLPKILDKMSSTEIETKNREEVTEIESAKALAKHGDAIAEPQSAKLPKRIQNIFREIPKVEETTLEQLQELLGLRINSQVKLGNLLLDGVSEDKDTTYFFEVKYFPKSASKQSEHELIKMIEVRLRYSIPQMLFRLSKELKFLDDETRVRKYVLYLVMVIEKDTNPHIVRKAVAKLKKELNFGTPKIEVRFAFSDGNKLEIL